MKRVDVYTNCGSIYSEFSKDGEYVLYEDVKKFTEQVNDVLDINKVFIPSHLLKQISEILDKK